jgi:hypothetical protein
MEDIGLTGSCAIHISAVEHNDLEAFEYEVVVSAP